MATNHLTWTYVKLFAVQLRRNVCVWADIPNSHAWRQSEATSPSFVLTKAQCVGILVSIHRRAERVELLIDDGTDLIRAVQWTTTWDDSIALGDLVCVNGKLNMDSSWSSDDQLVNGSRELRVTRITRLDDPNEELLHWADVSTLTSTHYNTHVAKDHQETHRPLKHVPPGTSRRQWRDSAEWDHVAACIFHGLDLNDEDLSAFLSRSGSSQHDGVLVDTVRLFHTRQRSQRQPLRVRFPEVLSELLAKEHVATELALHHALTRSLRYTFSVLRQSGLVYLEDPDDDRYVLVTAPLVLEPELTTYYQGKDQRGGTNVGDVVEWVLNQPRFQHLRIGWLETVIKRLGQSE